jgi:hypothetical protein
MPILNSKNYKINLTKKAFLTLLASLIGAILNYLSLYLYLRD